jgi:hypothetical protein
MAASELAHRWQIEHWEAQEVCDTIDKRVGDSIQFSTGHDAPIGALRTFSRKFPTLAIVLEWRADADYMPSRVTLRDGVGSVEVYEAESPQGEEIMSRLDQGDVLAEESYRLQRQQEEAAAGGDSSV